MTDVNKTVETAFRGLWSSIVRTATPLIVGAVAAWLVSVNFPVDAELQEALTLATGGVFTVLYYGATRVLETYVTPKFGWLLGLAKQPVYAPKNETVVSITGTGKSSIIKVPEVPSGR